MHSSMNYRCVMVHGKAEDAWSADHQHEVADPSEKWRSLDVIVDHAAGSAGFSRAAQRPMTDAEVASTRVLRLELKDRWGWGGAGWRGGWHLPSAQDIENPKLWAGIVPITRLYGAAVDDPSLRFAVAPPEAVKRLG
eukprot:Skav231209  [mRNA]  locus=scaffold2958:10511:13160:- [translate_table: standard]